MKEELLNKIYNLLTKMVGAAEDLGTLTAEQLPLLLQEILAWYGFYNFLFFYFALPLY